MISVRIHKEASSPLCTGAVAVLLFLAVCAYMGAGLFEKLSPSAQTVQAEKRVITESARLYGIALRQEQTVCSPDGRAFSFENFRKYSAAECAAVFGADTGSAVYFDNCDGYEYLSPDNLSPFSAESFSQLINSESHSLRGTSGRLVSDDIWYFAARVDSGTVPQKGSVCTVCFDGLSERCRALVWDVDADCVLLRLSRSSEELLSLRKCSAQLIFGQYEGIEIPRSALRRDREGNFYICVLSTGLVENRSVDIIYSDENFVLSSCTYNESAVREGEMIILVVSDEYR